MNKLVYGVVAVLGASALAVPFVGGKVMEGVVRDGVAKINSKYADSGQDIKAEIIRYERGYASSEIEWKIDFGKLKEVYGIDGIILVDRAEHGYSGIVSKTSLEKNPWYERLVKEKLGGKDPLHLTTRYSFTGGTETTATLDGFTVQAEGVDIAVKPGHTTMAFDKEFKRVKSQGSWQGLSAGEQMNLKDITYSADLTMIEPFTYIWSGAANMAMAGLTIKEQGQDIDLSGVKIDYKLTFDQAANSLGAVADYRVASLVAGPETVRDLGAKISVGGLSASGYDEFMKVYTKTVGAMAGDMAGAKNDPVAMQRAMEQKMAGAGLQLMSAGEKLLTKGLELRLSGLHLGLEEGEVKGDVALSLKKDMTFAQFIPLAGQPKLALEIFSLSSSISLPEKLVVDVPMLFVPIYQGMPSGVFVKNGATAVHKAETRDGKLYLNDKEFVLN